MQGGIEGGLMPVGTLHYKKELDYLKLYHAQNKKTGTAINRS